MLREAFQRTTMQIKGVDNAMALTGHIVMLHFVLDGVGHEQLAAGRHDVEGSITLGQFRIVESIHGECCRRLEVSAEYVDGSSTEVRGIEEGRTAAANGDGKSFRHRSCFC